MEIDFKTENVGDIVRKDYRTARIFKSHHIDFCCGGGKTIEQVCQERKLNEDQIRQELITAITLGSTDNTPVFDEWPLDLLADYIEKKHHRYVEGSTPLLKQYLKKLAAVHGHGAPFLHDMRDIFDESAENFAQHMKKEELILFPYIRKMASAQITHDSITRPAFGSIANPIAMMNSEHDTEGEHFRQLEELSNGYEVPEWACNTFAVTMNLLKEFQDDLQLHIHLENNILFPKSIQLEKTMKFA